MRAFQPLGCSRYVLMILNIKYDGHLIAGDRAIVRGDEVSASLTLQCGHAGSTLHALRIARHDEHVTSWFWSQAGESPVDD